MDLQSIHASLPVLGAAAVAGILLVAKAKTFAVWIRKSDKNLDVHLGINTPSPTPGDPRHPKTTAPKRTNK